jgi:indolepyruvate decarboxylase
MKMSIGSFLIDRLAAMGVAHIYGVPGDYNLEFLHLLGSSNRLPFVGTCNELNAAYAADGEARLRGMSVVLTTYGVGDLATLSAIAGSYAEGVPVLSISGAPPLHAIRSKALVHHTLADGNYRNVLNCFGEFTVAQALITPENAVDEINRVLKACWREKRPAYLQLPSDICFTEIEVPEHARILEPTASDTTRLAAATSKISARLVQAHRPLVLIDSMVRSQRLESQLERLIDHFGLPFATLGSAKAVLSETSSQFVGIYNGKASAPDVYERVANADCILSIGVRFVDSTSCWFSQSLAPNAVIDIQPFQVTVGSEYFAGVAAADLLTAILKAPAIASRSPTKARALASIQKVEAGEAPWGQDAFWRRIGRFIAPRDVIVAENGTSLAGLSQLKLPQECSFVSQPVWGAIGYTLPALLGTALAAPDRRHLLFIGDGSFQVTAQEFSTILRHRLKPVIFLINNQGYTIERLILGETSAYNDIANWRYADLSAVLAPTTKVHSAVVTNMAELEDVLKEAAAPTELMFIEVRFERMDSPKGMPAFGKVVRQYDYGHWAANQDGRG